MFRYFSMLDLAIVAILLDEEEESTKNVQQKFGRKEKFGSMIYWKNGKPKVNLPPYAANSSNKVDAMDQFFLSMCSTVKQFSPYFQHIAKTKIFHIISELELEQLRQNQPQTQSTISSPDSLQHPSQVQTQTVPTVLQLNHLPSFPHPRPQTINHIENPDHSNITNSARPNQFNMFDYPTNDNFYHPKSSN